MTTAPENTPQLQTLLVNIDQAESIRRGIAAPHSTAKIDIDLTDLTPDQRAWVAERHDKGTLYRTRGNAELLKVACPLPVCLLAAISAATAADAQAAAAAAAEAAKKEAERQANMATAKAGLLAGTARFRQTSPIYADSVYVDGPGDLHNTCLPRSPEIEPAIAAWQAAEAAKKDAAEKAAAEKDAAKKDAAEKAMEQRRELIRQHGSPEQIARMERGLMNLDDESQRLLNRSTFKKLLPEEKFPLYQRITDDELMALVEEDDGCDYSEKFVRRDHALTVVSDAQMRVILEIEKALPKEAVCEPKEGFGYINDDAIDGIIERPKLIVRLPVRHLEAVWVLALPEK